MDVPPRRIMLRRVVDRGRGSDGQCDRVRRHHRHLGPHLARDVLGQLQVHRARALLGRHAEASRTMVGMLEVLTIWRENLVSGFMVATMSTIWKRACWLLLIAFCPVIRIMGIAPRWA